MKIQHWAIIFIFIMIPLSIVCRNVISKKNFNLRDETRYNNIIDNATYDAVSQIIEVSEELEYGKNIPITEGVAMASIERFFNSLSVNFNLPIASKSAEGYFGQYIPAIVIIGYDGLYVYSCEETADGYEFKLKPKIPYTYSYTNGGSEVVINFTLDNYVSIYFPNDTFLINAPDEFGNLDADGTHVLSGYVGRMLDVNEDGIDDLWDDDIFNDDPYGIEYYDTNIDKCKYIKNQLPMFTDNLSYILRVWDKSGNNGYAEVAETLDFLYDDIDPTAPNQDYEYDDNAVVTVEASEFHKLRRDTIINLIMDVLEEEFNEHNDYADIIGVTYNFDLPDIGRDQWNNTIDDISILSFFQGMPMGADSYYNNYSLGGTRIVKASYLYAERVNVGGEEHKVYHKEYCPYIPVDVNGQILYGDTFADRLLRNGMIRNSTGIERVFINSTHAKQEGYYVCSQCM